MDTSNLNNKQDNTGQLGELFVRRINGPHPQSADPRIEFYKDATLVHTNKTQDIKTQDGYFMFTADGNISSPNYAVEDALTEWSEDVAYDNESAPVDFDSALLISSDGKSSEYAADTLIEIMQISKDELSEIGINFDGKPINQNNKPNQDDYTNSALQI